jgi:hypothetical protein
MTTAPKEKETMSTDLATIEDSSIELLPPQRPPSVVARQMLHDHAEMMQTAHSLAVAMCSTQMVPVRFRGKPDDGAAAILYGSELGLNPIQALQRVIPIHGMPSIEARTMVALLTARGYKVRTTAQADDSVTVEGEAPNGETASSTWTIDRANRAGYVPVIDERTGKYELNANGKLKGNEKYLTDPQAMLKAKAQAEVCRDLAPDVLMGISYTREELESEQWDGTVAIERPNRSGPAPVTVDEILAPTPAERPSDSCAKPEPEQVSAESDIPAKPFPADVTPEPADLDEDQDPTPAADPEPAPAKPAGDDEPSGDDETAKMTRKLYAILNKADVKDREDRLILFRSVLDRDDVTSTKELSTIELAKVVTTFERLSKHPDKFDEWITDAFNRAAMRELETAEAATDSEGN